MTELIEPATILPAPSAATIAARELLDLMDKHNINLGGSVRVGTLIQTSKGSFRIESPQTFLLSWANETLPDANTAAAVHCLAEVAERVLAEREQRKKELAQKMPVMTLRGKKK